MLNNQLEELTLAKYKELFQLNDKEKCKAVFEYAFETRKFEIDLYWKRATYFWTLIGATMAGFFVIRKSEAPVNIYLSVVIGCLGFLFSFAWFFVNKGSKYWQENWENHVDLIEDNFVGPLYKTVIDRPKEKQNAIQSFLWGPAAYSVSKINQIVSLCVCCFWLVLLLEVLCPLNFKLPIEWKNIPPIMLTIGACISIFYFAKTDKTNYINLRATTRKTTIEKN